MYCTHEDFQLLGKENNLIIMNHQYEIDWLVNWWFAEKLHNLGCSRGFVKNVIKFMPVAGWFFYLDDHVFLQRSFEKDKKTIEDHLKRYSSYPKPLSMTITAEGTRFSKLKHEASIEFAKERNLVPFKHHLIPRAGGFNLCVPLLKKYKWPMLYNMQVAFDKNADNAPTFGNLLNRKKVVAHIFFERIPMENVEPTFEFLYEIYKKKDELAEKFHKHGNFCEGNKNIEKFVIKRTKKVLINAIAWQVVVLSLLIFYSIKLILAGKILLLSIVFGSITILCE